MEKNTRTKALLIFAAAFFIRLGYSLWVERHYLFAALPGSDVLYYREWAYEIAAGRGTKGAFYGLPLYPYFLAMLFRLFGDDLFLIRLIHLFIGSINCVLGYLFCRKMFGAGFRGTSRAQTSSLPSVAAELRAGRSPESGQAEKVAILTGILMAGNFALIYYDWLLMPVGIIIALSFGIVFLALDFERFSQSRAVFLGILTGSAALADGKFLILVILLSLFFLLKYRSDFKKTLMKVLLLGLSCLLMIAPALLHNRIKSGDWILITAQSGYNFYVGNHPDSGGIFENPEFIRPSHRGQDIDMKAAAEAGAGRRLSDREVMDYWQEKGLDFIKLNPGQYLHLLLKKSRVFFTASEPAADPGWVLQRPYRDILDINPFWLLTPLALIGITAALRRRDPAGPVLLLIISQLIFTLIFFLNARHRAGIIPFFIIFESTALIYVFSAAKTKNFRPLAVAVSVLILYLLLFPPQRMPESRYRQLYFSKAGIAFERRGEWEKAVASYQKAVELAPGDTNAKYNLATAYLKTGRHQTAARLYQEVLTVVPHQADALFNLGSIYEEQGQSRQALHFYGRALAVEPHSADIHFRMARLLAGSGNCHKARPHVHYLLKHHPALAPDLKKEFSACPDAF